MFSIHCNSDADLVMCSKHNCAFDLAINTLTNIIIQFDSNVSK